MTKITNDYTIWLIIAVVIIILLCSLHVISICLCVNSKNKDEEKPLLN